MKNHSTTLFLSLFTPLSILAQNHDIFTESDTSIAQKLHNKGHFEAKIRQYSMATINKDKLADNYALAIGGGLHYESPILFKFLSVEMGGMFIYNMASSDLGEPDSTTQVKDRYEIALFDLENPKNRSDLDRMDEFNLRFHISKKSKITFGRQIINSPLMNPQDGRMRPSLMSGAWFQSKDLKNTDIQSGWLWAAAPRSTVRWFSVGESIGVYSNGVSPSGKKGNYFMNIESKGAFVGGIKNQSVKNLTLNAWHYFIENVSHTSFLQADFDYPFSKNNVTLKLATQIIHQQAVNQGGNESPAKTYMQADEKSWILGGRIGLAYKKHQLLLNYTRITEGGRFLFPREWGRDPLLTFMQRERNEGAGDVKAVNLVHIYKLPNMQTVIGFGLYQMPDVKNYAVNKYGLPSYTQANVSIKYNFKGNLKNLTLEALIVHKWGLGEMYENEKFRINKVDMTNFNSILNYNF